MIGKDNKTREGNERTLVSFSFSSAADAAVAVKLLLQLGATIIQQLEQLRSSSLVQGMQEPGSGGWDLETLVQNGLLPLEADVFGPFLCPGLNLKLTSKNTK